MMEVLDYAPHQAGQWDAFCAQAPTATFLHTRSFLSYHKDRFVDRSLILSAGGRWIAVVPLAQDPADAGCIVSHPGITYGGVLHQGEARGACMVDVIRLMSEALRARGYSRLRYKAVPHLYHRGFADDDLYALHRCGAVLARRDLSCAIDPARAPSPSARRLRGARKARAAGLTVVEGREHLGEFWPVLCQNLADKHGVRPVHSLQDMQELAARFPDSIRCVVARREGEVVAGTVLFVTHRADHAQYIASNAAGRSCGALDLLFTDCIARVGEGRFFDFGISTEEEGRVLNEGLHAFKSEFGGAGLVYDHYELPLAGGKDVD
jgi:hypothetical protein